MGERKEGFYLAAALLRELTEKRKTAWELRPTQCTWPRQQEKNLNRPRRGVTSSASPALSDLPRGLSPDLPTHSPAIAKLPWVRCDGGGEQGPRHSSSVLQWILLFSFRWSIGLNLLPHQQGLRMGWGTSLGYKACVCVHACTSLCVSTHVHVFSWGIIYMQENTQVLSVQFDEFW